MVENAPGGYQPMSFFGGENMKRGSEKGENVRVKEKGKEKGRKGEG
jgi:hypothetical protein